MAKISIEDLKKIKESVQAGVNLREGGYRAKVNIHMGTCGIASGARKLMTAVLDEIEKRDIKDVIVTTSGCAGLCSREPMATVEVQGQPPVKYVDLDAEKAKRIFREHIVGGNAVAEYALVQGSGDPWGSLADVRAIDLAVYSVDGRRVRTLARGQRAAGRHEVSWDGLDAAGSPLAPGIYLMRLAAGDVVTSGKIVRVR